MLQIKNLVKDYPAGNSVVHALKGISLDFRKSEFVSVLGPSGCGKTTMLNIIGGLDHYTSGDLIINGVSTRDYRDRDWDAYRNHSVGFVFQSYNLIPHQTVLQNVELALMLSGVSKAERRARARKALEDVGLGDQLNKRPGEMSGGQIQRVAIARAIVNNPDIILADEPTGALDTETSTQVMDILKEISGDRLVIMVTHNPDLAEKYSTRIINILDGVITADSNPMSEEETEAELAACGETAGKKKKVKLPSLSFRTAFMLSLKNLFTKKGRTILTCFAGSIGIIGIALILSVSQGTTDYIDGVQEDALTSYPITIESSTIDVTTLMETFMTVASTDVEHESDAVYKKASLLDMMSAFSNLETQENDLASFKEFLDEELEGEEDSGLYNAVSGIQYSYDLSLIVYTENEDGEIIESDTTSLLTELMTEYIGVDMESYMSTASSSSDLISSYSSTMTSSMAMWSEMLAGKDGSAVSSVLMDQYDVVYGEWPDSYDEIVLVLDENNELDDLTLYAMGLISEEEIDEILEGLDSDEETEDEEQSWSYEEICEQEFRVVLNSACYTYDEDTGLFADLRESDTGLRYLYDNALELKVVGIIKPNGDSASSMITGSIAYTQALTEYVITESQDSDAVTAQLEDPDVDVTNGLLFESTTDDYDDEQKEELFRNYVDTLDDNEKADLYVSIMSIPSDETIEASLEASFGGMSTDDKRELLISSLVEQLSMSEDEISEYADSLSDDEIEEFFEQLAIEQITAQYAEQMEEQLSAMTSEQLAAALMADMESYTEEDFAGYYDEFMEFSDSTYEDNLLELGYVDLDDPSEVNIYAASFADKEVIEDYIAEYNEGLDELEQITYTDYIGIMLSSVNTIINAITYVLIAFVAISLIVSSIMIAVITLISVQERTKEIGILRSIGASKRNVSVMFNAETLILGFFSGLFGVVITYLLCLPINAVLHFLTGISTLSARFPLAAAVILILISMLLTLIAGIIPSRSAAKKDPVEALRTE